MSDTAAQVFGALDRIDEVLGALIEDEMLPHLAAKLIDIAADEANSPIPVDLGHLREWKKGEKTPTSLQVVPVQLAQLYSAAVEEGGSKDWTWEEAKAWTRRKVTRGEMDLPKLPRRKKGRAKISAKDRALNALAWVIYRHVKENGAAAHPFMGELESDMQPHIEQAESDLIDSVLEYIGGE